jgi:hypothetical protein
VRILNDYGLVDSIGRLEIRLDGVWGWIINLKIGTINGLETDDEVAKVSCISMGYLDGKVLPNCLTEYRDYCGDIT